MLPSGTVIKSLSKVDFRFKQRLFCQHVGAGQSRRAPWGAAWFASKHSFSDVGDQSLITAVVTVVRLAVQRSTLHAPSSPHIKVRACALVAVQSYPRMINTFEGSHRGSWCCLMHF